MQLLENTCLECRSSDLRCAQLTGDIIHIGLTSRSTHHTHMKISKETCPEFRSSHLRCATLMPNVSQDVSNICMTWLTTDHTHIYILEHTCPGPRASEQWFPVTCKPSLESHMLQCGTCVLELPSLVLSPGIANNRCYHIMWKSRYKRTYDGDYDHCHYPHIYQLPPTPFSYHNNAISTWLWVQRIFWWIRKSLWPNHASSDDRLPIYTWGYKHLEQVYGWVWASRYTDEEQHSGEGHGGDI